MLAPQKEYDCEVRWRNSVCFITVFPGEFTGTGDAEVLVKGLTGPQGVSLIFRDALPYPDSGVEIVGLDQSMKTEVTTRKTQVTVTVLAGTQILGSASLDLWKFHKYTLVVDPERKVVRSIQGIDQ